MSGNLSRERFSYSLVGPEDAPRRSRPILSVTLIVPERRISFPALVDSGADINVIPYSLGLALGLNWNDSRIGPTLTGKFANIETRLIVLPTVVGNFVPIDLVFTWMAQDTGPVILGQMNFFREFNVYFYGAESFFELERATP
jgi:hypothetical protein